MTDWELLENNGTYVWLLKMKLTQNFEKKKRSGAVRKSGIVSPCRVCHLPSPHTYREVQRTMFSCTQHVVFLKIYPDLTLVLGIYHV